MISKWNYLPLTTEEQQFETELAKKFANCPPISELLVQRGITSEEEAEKFFHPSLKDMHDPFLMPDMDKAVNRLNKAMGLKEKILVYGDYDVDGTTAVALVYKYLQNFYSNIDYYIPTRYDEGYGISKRSIDEAVENGVKLVIILDCGIKAIEEIKYAKEKGLKQIGFEADHVSYSTYEVLKGAEETTWIPTKNVVEKFRQIKEEGELEKLAKAESIGDLAFKAIVPFIQKHWKDGLTENEVALEIERVMRQNGATGTSFNTIVASGAKSSLPHAVPGDEPLKKGDFVVMDFGCIYEGYCSDMTRTVVIGEASEKHKEIYETVLAAQKAALEGIRPGLKGKEIDAMARDYITKAGYGIYSTICIIRDRVRWLSSFSSGFPGFCRLYC